MGFRYIPENESEQDILGWNTSYDVLIRGLWYIQTESIIYVWFGYADAETYKKEGIDTLFLRWKKNKDKHGRHCQKQQRIFLCLSYQFMGYWVRRPKLYSLLWFKSWMRKLKNPFRTLKVGLTDGSQSRSGGYAPGCSAELRFQVPYRIGIQTGSWVQYWDCINTFIAPI